MVVTECSTCSPETARCPNARDYDVELRECCRSHVIGMMNALAEAFTRHNMTWWADYGALLGAVRNGMTTWSDYPWLRQDGRASTGPPPGIVPHDKDADLGVLWSDWGKLARVRADLARQHRFDSQMNWQRGSVKVRLSSRNHTNVDVFAWRVRKDGVTYFRNGYASVDKWKGKEFRHHDLFPLTTVEWEGMTLPAPRDPEKWLAFRYGPGWRTPIMANNDGVIR